MNNHMDDYMDPRGGHDYGEHGRGPCGGGRGPRPGGPNPFAPDPRFAGFPGEGFHHGPHGRHGRGRGRRGDVRAAVLNLLNEQPMTGYQLMGAIEEKSHGLWKPGPGSIYPALQLLADEGLVSLQSAEDGKKTYAITEAGRAYLTDNPEQTSAPWDRVTSDIQGFLNLRPELEKLAGAVAQVVKVADEKQQTRVQDVLVRARKEVYRILAEDEDAGQGEPTAEK